VKTSNIKNISLTSYDDIFKNNPIDENSKCVVEIPLAELFSPETHPFQVNDDEAMTRLSENIKCYGVREPGLARPRAEGGYELLCGNRRKRACELAGIATMPVIIRELDDDEAVICMVDSNLEQREKLLYSEKSWAYRMKLEALDHNGKKGDMLSVDTLAKQTGESKNQIFRLIRLTELIYSLLDKVDAKRLAFNPAVELSYLSQIEQMAVASAMDKYDVTPSLSQAQRLKKLKKTGELTDGIIDSIIAEQKSPKKNEPKSSMCFRKYFPIEYSQKQIEEVIIELLTNWKAGIIHVESHNQ